MLSRTDEVGYLKFLMKLSKLLEEVPDSLFWTERRGERIPHYNRIFAEVLRQSLDLEDLSDTIQLHQVFTSDIPNLSSFQRAVAKEASNRRKHFQDPVRDSGKSEPEKVISDIETSGIRVEKLLDKNELINSRKTTAERSLEDKTSLGEDSLERENEESQPRVQTLFTLEDLDES